MTTDAYYELCTRLGKMEPEVERLVTRAQHSEERLQTQLLGAILTVLYSQTALQVAEAEAQIQANSVVVAI